MHRVLGLSAKLGLALFGVDILRNLFTNRRRRRRGIVDITNGGCVYIVTTAALPWRTGEIMLGGMGRKEELCGSCMGHDGKGAEAEGATSRCHNIVDAHLPTHYQCCSLFIL